MASARTKRCPGCKRLRRARAGPDGDFYAHATTADRLSRTCKACARAAAKRNYRANHAHYVAYDAARAATPARRANKAARERDYRRRNPGKYRARTVLHNAVRDGKVRKPPCQGCGARTRVETHHLDYRSPLKVAWLCFRCHRERGHGHVVARRKTWRARGRR